MFFSVLLGRSLSCQRIVDEQRRSSAPETLGAEAATPALATSPSHGDSFTGHRLPQSSAFCVFICEAQILQNLHPIQTILYLRIVWSFAELLEVFRSLIRMIIVMYFL